VSKHDSVDDSQYVPCNQPDTRELRDDPRARQVGEIVEKAKGQHYQLACGMTFEAGLHKLNERS
jgi:hypothetical protein